MNRKQSSLSLYGLTLVIALATLLALLQANGATATSDLPPRPTVIPGTNVPGSDLSSNPAKDGGRIQLHAQFSQAWPWNELHWQSLWTVVQWYDADGNWHVVDGWQGNLDTIEQKEAGWVGQKEWWAGAEILGSGPYRWLVYRQDGQLLATSDAFALPDVPGGLIIVELLLEP